MSGRSTAALHFFLCTALIFFFGSKILTLSVDFALHYGLIDALMKTGVADPQTVGAMSGYPKLGHWMAAGFEHLIGSGVVAMWLVSIVSIYILSGAYRRARRKASCRFWLCRPHGCGHADIRYRRL